jgi:hypothetical protein
MGDLPALLRAFGSDGPLPWRAAVGLWIAYVVALLPMIWLHEPWADEAQAWLLARDAGPVELVTTWIHYEGSPALWSLLLMPLAKTGCPATCLTAVAVAAAATATWLWLWRFPGPRILAAAAPFSFFLFFQYAVVARNYVLLAPLIFSWLTVTGAKRERPLAEWGLLALIAQVSLHGTLISACLGVGRACELAVRGRLPVYAVLLLVSVASAFAQSVPPKDYDGPAAASVTSPMEAGRRAWLYFTDAFTPGGAYWSFAIPFFFVSCAWFWRCRSLATFLPATAALLLLAGVKYVNRWHEGALVIVWLAAWWRAGEAGRLRPPVVAGDPLLRGLAVATGAAAIGLQVWWGISTWALDVVEPYSGSRALAAVVRDQMQPGETVAPGDFWGVAVLPYLPASRLPNGARGFWVWSSAARQREKVPADHVVAGRPLDTPAGYELQAECRGRMFWKGGVAETETYRLFSRVPLHRSRNLSEKPPRVVGEPPVMRNPSAQIPHGSGSHGDDRKSMGFP